MGLDAGVGLNELVKAPDQAAAAGHDDAVGGDVRHQLRGRPLQNGVNGVYNALGRLLEGLDHLAGGDGDGPGETHHLVVAGDLHGLLLRAGEDAAERDLQLLRRAGANEQIVLAADILDDGVVKGVAGDLDGGGLHHTGQGDDGNIRGAAADIHHQVALRLGDVNAGADGGGHRLFDEVDLPCACVDAGVDDGPLLHLSDAGGDADDHTGLEKADGSGLADKLP